ncbi:hypothetical protein A8C56_03380 [Niabella ginsenosidivorans]|uniref:Uncharacterized protein n=1 Tax=Niabella ginsenosidivorans TaxID=1176587 RepID=A0A1A9I0S0_9BACT|nr:hypothetical protein [Niabella ginsenosidivorans]ANH80154.1 hypothetical protein A8C56_03380 [Niabella ginsenosidivorans]
MKKRRSADPASRPGAVATDVLGVAPFLNVKRYTLLNAAVIEKVYKGVAHATITDEIEQPKNHF